MQRALTLLVLLATLGGCLGGEPSQPEDAQRDALEVHVGCDTALFGGVRGREVDVAVDPNNRSRVAAAAMLTPPSLRDAPAEGDLALWNGLARSGDGGLTWQTTLLPYWPGDPSGTHPAFVGAMGFGDPIVSFAPNGDLYLGAIILTGLLQYNMVGMRFPGDALEADTITVFSRGGYGLAETNMVPGFNPVGYNDKNDQVVDPETGVWYVTWMWRSNASPAGISTVPVVVSSADGGATWDGPVTLVQSPLGGITSGETNLAPAPLILGENVVVLWSRPGDGIWAAAAPRGTLDFGTPFRIAELGPTGGDAANVLTLPMVNVATGPRPDGTGERAYVVAIHGGDGFDVGLWWSDDGATWNGPLTPHARTTNAQLIPTVAVAPDGRVAVQFIDFSQDPQNTRYHTLHSVSADGGLTWIEHQLTSVATDAAAAGDAVQAHVGDYFGNAFTSAGLLGAWQDGRDGTADDKFSEIYTCVARPPRPAA